MKYISAKEFFKQSKQVQDTILEWWQPSIGDIYCNRYGMPLGDILVINNGNFNWKSFKDDVKQYGIPLLTEGQLRKFIEERVGNNISVEYEIGGLLNISFLNRCGNKEYLKDTYSGEDILLEILWGITIEIIKEEIK